ncbi:hypothetical protein BJ684DRAFT_18634 [Piptocephalis cylindrospora]|uniref:Uncharacterized protein n=1 Tax=Piptocephalis cylindrospora TaxID=1907219 RepID=A0A4P9Y884_9FUNG|nr:hypothetical protein BJ684DRAFT_18634 [Piptocephalis cylindrospora]|eukprot:RKP15002.1 hypothetical protein BJ684DRAFT_18634 [Piptocephalis cylindrospora]
MDLNLDPLHDGMAPGEMPCRWLVNVRECKDEWYYVGIIIMGMIQAVIMTACGLLLLRMTKKERVIGYIPWKWTSSTWAHIGFVLLGLQHLTLSLVFILNPRTAYWFRLFLQFAFFFISYNCTLPYLFSLVSSKFVIIWQRDYQEIVRRRTRRVLYTMPLIFSIFIILISLSGSFLDRGQPHTSEIIFRISMGVCMLGNGIAAWVCYVYGYRFSHILSRQLEDMNSHFMVSADNSDASSSPDERPRSPPPPEIKVPPGSKFLPGPSAAVYARPSPAAPRMARTLMEGKAVLRMMGVLNSLFVSVNITCLIIALLCLVFPVKMYTVPIFSKILFFFAFPNRIAFKTVVSVAMFIVERKRLQDREDLQTGRVTALERVCIQTNRYYELHCLQESIQLQETSTTKSPTANTHEVGEGFSTVSTEVVLEEEVSLFLPT